MTPDEKAAILVAEVRAALARGTKHYDADGRPLTTPEDILKALQDAGRVVFVPPESKAGD